MVVTRPLKAAVRAEVRTGGVGWGERPSHHHHRTAITQSLQTCLHGCYFVYCMCHYEWINEDMCELRQGMSGTHGHGDGTG